MLIIKALAGCLNLVALLCLSIFLPAWTLDFWEAWVYLSVFSGMVLFITIYFLRRDPMLIQRRLRAGPVAEQRFYQKILQSVASLLFILIMVVSGLDRHLHWSEVPVVLIVGADIVVFSAFMLIFLVFRENSYSSGVIEITTTQKVISTGPYAVVRHPMYSGACLLLLFTPIALGSWRAIPVSLVLAGVIILRLLDEEKLLLDQLPRYHEYCGHVPFRLIPGIW